VLAAQNLSCAPDLTPFLASSSQAGSTAADDDVRQAAFSRALLLSFLASQNRSLFGAKCMVDTLIEVYRRGYGLDDVKLMITLGTLGKLEPLLGDIMLAWASVIMMSLQAVGLQLYPQVGGPTHGQRQLLQTTTFAAWRAVLPLNPGCAGVSVSGRRARRGRRRGPRPAPRTTLTTWPGV
jgi:hypothetical protein